MRVAVLGAGVIGVTTAWYLAEAGFGVTVFERRDGPALETSFANGGQISVSHAEPWAGPRAWRHLARWLGREEAPLLWRLRADAAQWAWGARFLRQCSSARAAANMRALIRLGLASRAALGELRDHLALEYDHVGRGILHIYTQPGEYAHARDQAARMTDEGCTRQVHDVAACLALEPALAQATRFVGGIHTPDDESGDAHRFTCALAAKATNRGVVFRHGAAVDRIEHAGDAVAGIRLADGERIAADAVVVALGSHAPSLLRPMGIHLPIYPAKGYSVTFALAGGMTAPTVSLTDDEQRIVMSRLGDRLRVAGTAEFAGYDERINVRRCEAIRRRTMAWFPSLADCGPVEYWTGLRPSTPGNVPIIGQSRVRGLWINGGHGTLGWTLACGSAQLLAELMAQRAPTVDPTPYAP